AVLGRQWLRLLEVGGNVYYMYKLAACDGMTFRDLAGEQTGMSAEDFARMMLTGGRPREGNVRRDEREGR
ncbi:MAG: protocatechuate 4,5-dioxygenase subunit alpha, partial [Acidimicrobiales bacterium]